MVAPQTSIEWNHAHIYVADNREVAVLGCHDLSLWLNKENVGQSFLVVSEFKFLFCLK